MAKQVKRLSDAPILKQYFISSPLLNFKEMSPGLHLGSPVIPGQDIVFWWESDLHASTPLDLGTVSISLVLVDVFGNTDPTGQLYFKTLTRSDSQAICQKPFTSDLIVVHLSDEIANRVYQLGTHKVRLVVSGTGTDGPYESSDVSLTVEPPTVNDTWWIWTSPSTHASWKQAYLVSANFINISMAAVTASVTLLEKPQAGGEVTKDSRMLTSLMGPGQTSPVLFTPITQSWEWFLPFIFTLNGTALVQSFSYRIRLDITDQYKNSYAPFFSTTLMKVDVKVSDEKQFEQNAAMGGMIVAAGCLITAAALLATGYGILAAGVWASAAATAAGIAQAFGAKANDPPVPDPAYRSLFEPVPVSVTDNEDMAPLLNLLRTAAEIAAHIEAMGQTDSRLAGARAVRDKRSTDLQRQHFRALSHRLIDLSKEAHRVTAPAADWFVTYLKQFSRTLSGTIQGLGHDLTLRANLQKAFLEAGGAASTFELLTAQAATPEFTRIIANPGPLIFAFGRFTEKVAKANSGASPTEQKMPPAQTVRRRSRRR